MRLQAAADRAASKHIDDSRNRGKAGALADATSRSGRRRRRETRDWRGARLSRPRARPPISESRCACHASAGVFGAPRKRGKGEPDPRRRDGPRACRTQVSDRRGASVLLDANACAAPITAEQSAPVAGVRGQAEAARILRHLGRWLPRANTGHVIRGGVNAVGRERNRAAPGCVWIATVPEAERSSDIRIGPACAPAGASIARADSLCGRSRLGYDRLDRSPSGTPQLRFRLELSAMNPSTESRSAAVAATSVVLGKWRFCRSPRRSRAREPATRRTASCVAHGFARACGAGAVGCRRAHAQSLV